ncbi:hypothetical protein BT69DRAFT_320525 [Atractiella rhizophila]|nr:hypothetical protein BT69DRAFT_320525 [Atractiella rhizophila]
MREASVNRRNRVNLMNQMERSRGRHNSAAARLGQSTVTPISDPTRRAGVRSPISGFRKQSASEGKEVRPRSVAGMASTISPTLGGLKAKSIAAAAGGLGRRSPIPSSFRNPNAPPAAPSSGAGRARTLSAFGKVTPPPTASTGTGIGRGAPSAAPTGPGLRKKASASNLNSGSGSNAPTLSRKRSMPSLSINAARDGKISPSPVGATGPGPRSRTTTSTTSTIASTFSTPSISSYASGSQSATASRFAAPTLSSMSKRRGQSDDGNGAVADPSHGRSTSLGYFSNVMASHRPSTPSTLTQPTASSLAKTRPPSRSSTMPNMHVLKRPKRVRNYGDGTELDAFDDLPTNRDDERKFLGSSGNSKSLRRVSGVMRSERNGSGETVLSGGSKGAPATSTNTASRLNDRKASAGGSTSTIGKKKRTVTAKKPQLIRSLNASSLAKVQGEMMWNPIAHRWEGNESVLKDFERAMGTSVRPALITNYSAASTLSPSPTRVGSPSTIASAKLPNGVRVVGNMIFDPIQMKWYSNDDQEDDLDLDLVLDDDEFDEWEEGEQARMLKNRASFMSDASASSENGEEDLFWKECEEGEARTTKEFEEGGWIIEGSEGRRARGERDHLWDIRNSNNAHVTNFERLFR